MRVALTFDAEHPDRAGASAGNAERILDTLAARQVPATFFVQSRWAQAEPAVARRIADDGYLIGNHSAFHARMTLFSDAGLATDVREAEDAIASITGRHPIPWFRCPFGDGHDDDRVLRILADLGYRNVHWNVEAADWDPTLGPAEVTEAVVVGVTERGDGAVVLLHTWPDGTALGLDATIERLLAVRATFVTVDALEELP